MAEVILMPRLSDTMTEGVIAAWHKKVGDTVSKGDVLTEIETDKATMELESYKDGILLYQGAKAGEKIQVNDLLCIIGKEGLDVNAIVAAVKGGASQSTVSSQQSTEKAIPVLGITGTGGAGKSSVTDEIVRRYLTNFTNKTIAVISVDPSKKKTGGALLGDRIRMNAISHPRAYMRSLATREDNTAISAYLQDAINICKQAAFDLIVVESAGVGQSDASILDYCDVSLYVMTPEYGAASQLEKINMLDYADVICINKFDKAGALDALQDVRKQYKRNHNLWTAKDEELPVVGSIAAQFVGSPLNACFVSNLEAHILRWQPRLWLHGHVHCRHDYAVDRPGRRSGRVICQAMGLPRKGEDEGFDPLRLIAVPGRA